MLKKLFQDFIILHGTQKVLYIELKQEKILSGDTILLNLSNINIWTKYNFFNIISIKNNQICPIFLIVFLPCVWKKLSVTMVVDMSTFISIFSIA